MRSRPVTCLLATLAVVVSTSAAASAETVIFKDPRRDASARFDLTRTSVSNGGDRVLVVQRVRNLRGGRTQTYGFNVSRRGGDTIVHSVRRKSGTIRSRAFGPEGEVDCDIRARWRLGRDSIRVSVPRSCLAGK